ncbi:MAG: hypothetical protein CM15mP103_05360 [Gammaproteobacteria bacterium]|nr:MAG: hypothetical protein CM15mP103_05360 [Gammaproteobacteria bacterium]
MKSQTFRRELYVTTELMGDVTIALSSILYLESDRDIELLTTSRRNWRYLFYGSGRRGGAGRRG